MEIRPGKRCRSCKRIIPAESETCPYCGTKFFYIEGNEPSPISESKMNSMIWKRATLIAVGILVVLSLGALCGYYFTSSMSYSDKTEGSVEHDSDASIASSIDTQVDGTEVDESKEFVDNDTKQTQEVTPVAVQEPAQEVVKKPVHTKNVCKMTGNIGPYPVTLFLDYETCEGYYYYNDRPKAIFRLDCARQETGFSNDFRISKTVRLKEYYTQNGKNTGIFDGWLEMAAGRGEALIGTFTNTTNGKKYEFYIENGHFALGAEDEE